MQRYTPASTSSGMLEDECGEYVKRTSVPALLYAQRERAAKLVEAERDRWQRAVSAAASQQIAYSMQETANSLNRLAEQIRSGE